MSSVLACSKRLGLTSVACMDALGLDPDDEDGVRYTYRPEFLQSHWKRFHDAVQMHRLFVLHELLPRRRLPPRRQLQRRQRLLQPR